MLFWNTKPTNGRHMVKHVVGAFSCAERPKIGMMPYICLKYKTRLNDITRIFFVTSGKLLSPG